jgi:hypothetical protein
MDGQVFSTSPGKRKILRNGDANTLVIPNVFRTLPPPLRVCDNSGFVFSRFNVFNVVNLGLPDVCVDCNLGTAGKITSTASLNNTPQRQVQFPVRLDF